MSVQLSQVLTTARTYLNDDNSVMFPDPVLIPKIQEAHRELQTELWVNGSPIVRAQTAAMTIPINANPTNLNTLAPVGFPTDFLLATALFESSAGTYIPITEVIYFPVGYTALADIRMWSSQEDNVILAPCTASKTVIMQYRRSITIPSIATDAIGILFGEIYLAARGAGIAAGSVGNKAAHDELTALAKNNFAKLLLSNRGQQKAMVSPGMGYAGFNVPNNSNG